MRRFSAPCDRPEDLRLQKGGAGVVGGLHDLKKTPGGGGQAHTEGCGLGSLVGFVDESRAAAVVVACENPAPHSAPRRVRPRRGPRSKGCASATRPQDHEKPDHARATRRGSCPREEREDHLGRLHGEAQRGLRKTRPSGGRCSTRSRITDCAARCAFPAAARDCATAAPTMARPPPWHHGKRGSAAAV